ncbi:hypothetical protein [Ktedonobacter racemifer]|uniref:hypothetical protein n=1 Tax=Ktedonobacter racemifer TaxID=363277 RepID=UPI001FCB4E81|nr:hypothetical protein [Ktedonobacter racemifer]
MAASQHEGIGRTQPRLDLAVFVFGQWSNKNGGFHALYDTTFPMTFRQNALGKTHVYKTGIALVGQGQDLTPAQVTFQDLDGDGKPDMIVTLGEQSIAYKNDNDVFRPTPMKEVKP